MNIKIVVDSCCEIPSMWRDLVHRAANQVDIDDATYIDDNSLNLRGYLTALKGMRVFKTACPGPQDFLSLYEGDEHVVVIAASSNLSGSYQCALVAREMYFEAHGEHKTIYVMDSFSASAGQTAILARLMELREEAADITEVVSELETFRGEHKIMFVLQSLATLAKSGRVNPVIAKAAEVLGIRCIMSGTSDGKIELTQKIVGEKRCFRELAKQISAAASFAGRTLCISHCDGRDRVDAFLKDLAECMDIQSFKNILINHTGAVTSLYAGFGGIVVSI